MIIMIIMIIMIVMIIVVVVMIIVVVVMIIVVIIAVHVCMGESLQTLNRFLIDCESVYLDIPIFPSKVI